MNRNVYWGLGVLIILIIGVSVFLVTRTPETEPEIIHKPLTPAQKAEVDRNIQDAIDKAKKDTPPIAEVEHQQVPNKNSQQNNSVEPVLVENYLEGLEEIDMFASITLPTNDELAIYTDEDIKKLYRVIHEEVLKADAIDEKYQERNRAIMKAAHEEKNIAKRSQLLDLSNTLLRKLNDRIKRNKQWRQEIYRIQRNTQHYGRGF